MLIAGLQFSVGASTGARHLVWEEDYRVMGMVAVPAGRPLCGFTDELPFTSWGGAPTCRWCLHEAEKLDPRFELPTNVPVHPDQLSLF